MSKREHNVSELRRKRINFARTITVSPTCSLPSTYNIWLAAAKQAKKLGLYSEKTFDGEVVWSLKRMNVSQRKGQSHGNNGDV